VGGPSEPSSRSNHDSPSASDLERAISSRLDKIASVLQNLLEVSHEMLERLEELKEVEIRQSKVIEEEGIADYLPKGINVSTLLDLPDHLRKPLMTIFKLGGRGTAVQVSEKLGMSRPQASSTLNSLVRLRLLSKKREGKEGRRGADAIFMVPENKT
jgi:DNA-binding transcriptional regulator GbsR (MarR family)